MDGTRVDRVQLYPSHHNSSLKRALNLLSFFLSALAYDLCRARQWDTIEIPLRPSSFDLAVEG
jgi:colanic acid biosynthesis glycosyl transferase WcaI